MRSWLGLPLLLLLLLFSVFSLVNGGVTSPYPVVYALRAGASRLDNQR